MESVGRVHGNNYVIVDLNSDKFRGRYQDVFSPGTGGQVIDWNWTFMQQKQKVILEGRVNDVLSDVDLEGVVAVREWKKGKIVRVTGYNVIVIC